MNGKLAVELLFEFAGGRPNTPSGSKEKEGLLMDQRKEIMAEVRHVVRLLSVMSLMLSTAAAAEVLLL